jgi:hypothetical protein
MENTNRSKEPMSESSYWLSVVVVPVAAGSGKAVNGVVAEALSKGWESAWREWRPARGPVAR